MVLELRLPAEARALPPPGIVNRNSVWLGLIGWTAALLQNGINRRPAFTSGVHRQLLYLSVGWFVGYHVTKLVNYKTAKMDKEMMDYMQHHPSDFPEVERKTFAEILENFHPIR
ncbi:NADH dehydrogenase [ubiquinone] 1 subunit C2 [Leucoraja erinacea]|uniref:NADH dehydrogenase [ubiquinone] 1 subunit C2 n=1 Tax=Leucoraja erinaceus TaxID=7782 RepID=UPI0024565AF9|nr:NADH dehydrogenase [ubiquinone] 1 subunit C2 [Leucoraja erinacea]